MNRLLLLLILTTTLFACGDNAEKKQSGNNAADSTKIAKADSAESYLPIEAFLQNEMTNVESYAAGILRKSDTKGKKDSAYVQLPQFRQAAAQFLLAELDSAFFRDHFTETSFMDQTTEMFNFIYTAKDSASPLQKAVVYLQPGEAGAKPDRIYFETQSNTGDTLVEKKLTWKMRKYFYILTVKQPKSGNAVTTMEKLIWDPQHFGDE